MTLTYFFRVKKLNFNVSEKARAIATSEMTKYRTFLATFKFCKVQMNTKLCLQNCLHLYGTLRRVGYF